MSNGIVRRRGSIDVVDAKVAVDLATKQSYKENVFLFVPNLIGTSTACSLSDFRPPHYAMQGTRVSSLQA